MSTIGGLVGGAWTLNTIVTLPTQALAVAAIVLFGVPGFLYWKWLSRKASRDS